MDNVIYDIDEQNESVKQMIEAVSAPSGAAALFDEVTILPLCLILVMLLISGWVDLKLPSGKSMLVSNHFAIPG